MERIFHKAESYIGNPVLKPDKSWEKSGPVPWARPVSDGVWYDPEDKLFKMWYMAGMYPRKHVMLIQKMENSGISLYLILWKVQISFWPRMETAEIPIQFGWI
jgi:hypothetical protein